MVVHQGCTEASFGTLADPWRTDLHFPASSAIRSSIVAEHPYSTFGLEDCGAGYFTLRLIDAVGKRTDEHTMSRVLAGWLTAEPVAPTCS
jgi:hypothetical protein